MSQSTESNNGHSKPAVSDDAALPLNETVVVGVDGSLTIKGARLRESTDSTMSEIIEKLRGPDFQAVEIHRLIATQIALITRTMLERREDLDATTVLKEGAERIKALRCLAESVEEVDALTKRDELNFDGPKFEYVFDEFMDCFKDATEQALGKNSGEIVQRIMRTFRDLIAMREEDIRQATAKIGKEKAS